MTPVNTTPRRAGRAAPTLALVFVALTLSGCESGPGIIRIQLTPTGDGMCAVPTIAPTPRGRSSSRTPPSSPSSDPASVTPSSTVGPVAEENGGGLPTGADGDGQTTIPDHGANPSKAQIGEMLEAAASRHGIPADILKAVAWQESSWRPDASSFDGGHGKGVMQIDDRFHEFARTPEVWNPAKNIDYGARFLREKYDQTGSWEGALLRYNGGASYPPVVMGHVEQKPWTAVA